MLTTEDLATVVDDLLDATRDAGLSLLRETAELDRSGWDYLVIHAVDTDGVPWVVRAPRRPEVAELMGPEGAVLDLVRPVLPVAAPDWRVRTPRFAAYPRLPGQIAATEDPDTLVHHWHLPRERFGEEFVDQLARTLALLHRVDVEKATATGVPSGSPSDQREEIAERLERARAAVEVPERWWRYWQRWLRDDCLPPRGVLVHGDPHPGHLLVEPSGRDVRLVGLLDWGDAQVGDPALDFCDVHAAFGDEALDRLLTRYERHGGLVWPGARRHIVAMATLRLANTALYGVNTGQPRFVAAARNRLRTPPPDQATS
ncbi:macrolide phosphotransferase [Streptoalloteichus tenebrarius]|uniref:Macrolide phosphotransferase n=1 Tax=Streptoalloteichus tenebrarius (strain ATCC 17920 / DSM 40477 / JCM 4838 / CBS 697.72 / NBRC 16177 / NCIMB 11028 / NRRL B-12390 / A12253. 1 / ISP 5477) TaxID=1933 RepID=A0ABT1HYG0_STRSD|nr:macrolide 2'-phosphotransferase [Streptoalloteichus tenebrarius]MCP2260568.1 macrolide phosphotransferase [Streptoalloteichus tenebrarius]BFF01911.1 macrolide 2'-phosphotransferase MphK [Streptoalloteichus tenebrarius]